MSTEYDILAGTGIKVGNLERSRCSQARRSPDSRRIAGKARRSLTVLERYDGAEHCAKTGKVFADDGRVWQNAVQCEPEPEPEPEPDPAAGLEAMAAEPVLINHGPMPPVMTIGEAVFAKDAGIVGGITGIDAMQAAAQAPLTEFVMARPPRGGWVIFNHRYGNPLAAFSTFDEACDMAERPGGEMKIDKMMEIEIDTGNLNDNEREVVNTVVKMMQERLVDVIGDLASEFISTTVKRQLNHVFALGFGAGCCRHRLRRRDRVHAAMSAPLTIESVWMAVSVDANGNEGVCAILLGQHWMPLIAADRDRLPFVLRQAEEIADLQEKHIKIIRLTERSEIKSFGKEKRQ